MELQPIQPLAFSSELSAVGATLLKNPLFILKPKSTFVASDPLYFTLFLLIVFIIYTYIRTKRSDNLSWVDRLWSVMPVIYVGSMLLHCYYHSGILNQRLGLMFLLQLGWGSRLTYNLYIKGGYKSKHEDYRWELIRTWFNGRPYRYELFILFCNVLLQQIIIWSFSVLPSYIVYYGGIGNNKIGQSLFDLLIVFLYSIFFVIETIADQQMFEFQQEKKHIILSRKFSNINPKFSKGFFQVSVCCLLFVVCCLLFVVCFCYLVLFCFIL